MPASLEPDDNTSRATQLRILFIKELQARKFGLRDLLLSHDFVPASITIGCSGVMLYISRSPSAAVYTHGHVRVCTFHQSLYLIPRGSNESYYADLPVSRRSSNSQGRRICMVRVICALTLSCSLTETNRPLMVFEFPGFPIANRLI